jgi:hypothetical protein
MREAQESRGVFSISIVFVFALAQRQASAFSHRGHRKRQAGFGAKMRPQESPPFIVSSLGEEREEGNAPTPSNISTRLILHLDINETILLGDESGGDSRHDSVNKMLAKSAFCQIPSSSPTTWEDTLALQPTNWWDGQAIGSETTIPPLYTGWTWPENCCPYYRTSYKSVSKTFVEHHGSVYKPVLDQCEKALAASSSDDHVLPALYHTMNHLVAKQQEQPFTLVFRTFGTDLPDMAKAVTAFCQGKHPDYPDASHPKLCLLPDRLFQGRWKKTSNDVIYQLWDLEEIKIIASGDEEILQLLDSVPICGIRDDYNYWAANDWLPTAGKPVWIPRYTKDTIYDHHILFDDNIHNLAHDGIACVRQQEADGSFVTVDAKVMHKAYQGLHLIRVPTVEPVLNPNWFVEQLEKARGRVARRLAAKGDEGSDNDTILQPPWMPQGKFPV